MAQKERSLRDTHMEPPSYEEVLKAVESALHGGASPTKIPRPAGGLGLPRRASYLSPTRIPKMGVNVPGNENLGSAPTSPDKVAPCRGLADPLRTAQGN